MAQPRVQQPSEYAYLDQENFKSRYASGQDRAHIRFFVDGVSCGKCVRKIEDLLLSTPGLKKMRVELGSNLAEVEVDPQQLSFAALAEKIHQLGYNPIPITPESGAEGLAKQSDRREMIRLGIAAACAGNIMTFSFATYLGAPPEFSELFRALSFALYLPVVTYVARPFYLGAWRSIKLKQISIDLPMAVASLSGFIFSTVELLRGREDIYFDSLAGFLLLILLSRAFQRRLQRRWLRPQELMESLRLEKVRRVGAVGWEWIPVETLEAGQRILLRSPETLPAECELLSSRSHFSMAWLSGESRPQTFLRGSVVPAGARLLSGEAHLIARKPLRETGFGRILEEVRSFSLSSNRIVSVADRCAQTLIVRRVCGRDSISRSILEHFSRRSHSPFARADYLGLSMRNGLWNSARSCRRSSTLAKIGFDRSQR